MIVRMNRFGPSPTLRLFDSCTCVIKPALVEKVAVAIWTSSPRYRGDRIDDGSKVALACSLCLLCLFSILNICACTVPPHDLSGVVAERLDANNEPSIDAIMAPNTRLDLV